ncbi:MAG TPA: GMC family oxidoreductase N-terminal domain-containing protein [Paraburkholderia sp.]|uniref:GMC family oxidoreductase N-terminal domain-containing protein n=1 Tax=Paraburkholderia sp. TaxID=1926495 RepID=UPI002C632FE7|nr:GMC family oxidoreductase N-terminal domain-containing protein [Paraburkholderia sp.]HTR08522.1 GMC family oxidoreductase N-terminal domain-containing protein [Paraburkholderia sp.]
MGFSGIPRIDNYNGTNYEGVRYLQLSVGQGRRCSTAIGYLHGRPQGNLRMATGALVTRLLFDGSRVTGVEYRRNGETRTAHAAREVVLSAGSNRRRAKSTRARHSGAAASTRRGREPDRPCAVAHHLCLHAIDHAQRNHK